MSIFRRRLLYAITVHTKCRLPSSFCRSSMYKISIAVPRCLLKRRSAIRLLYLQCIRLTPGRSCLKFNSDSTSRHLVGAASIPLLIRPQYISKISYRHHHRTSESEESFKQGLTVSIEKDTLFGAPTQHYLRVFSIKPHRLYISIVHDSFPVHGSSTSPSLPQGNTLFSPNHLLRPIE